jgi:guanylate cyclase
LAPLVLVGLGGVYLAYDETVVGWLYVGFGLWVWLNLTLYGRVHRRYEIGFWSVAIPTLFVHMAAILELGDFVHSGGIVLWGLAYPIATGIVFVRALWLTPFYVVYAINVLLTAFYTPAHPTRVPPGVQQAILAINVLSLSAFAVVILGIFVAQRDRAYRLLGAEQSKVRALLLSILPERVADELATSPHVIAEQFDEVSVLFADVVGFTPMSADMTAAELVEILDELFGAVDELVDEAGLEKIKTIGDCYMVAAGVPVPRADHAVALVALAQDMQRLVDVRRFHGRRLDLRIGVNSGPVVAGVIGRRKFSYDLWGDVVNTASRMESHGVVGRVQITASTEALVRSHFACTPRGAIEVKGKGPVQTWVVDAERRRPRPRNSASPATVIGA